MIVFRLLIAASAALAQCPNVALDGSGLLHGSLQFPAAPNTPEGEYAHVVCDAANDVESLDSHRCSEDGTWFPPSLLASCVPTQKACLHSDLTDPNAFDHGSVTFASTSIEPGYSKVGDDVSVTCEAYARAEGQLGYTCLDKDTWSEAFSATCTPACPQGFHRADVGGLEVCLLLNTATQANAEVAAGACEGLSSEPPPRKTSLPVLTAPAHLTDLAAVLKADGYTGGVWLDASSALPEQQLCFAPDPLFNAALGSCVDLEIGHGPSGAFATRIANADCEQRRRTALCQTSQSGATDGPDFGLCPRAFFPYGDLCYAVSSEPLSQADAESWCQERQSSPAMPKTPKEAEEVAAFLTDVGRWDGWLGLRLYTSEAGNHCLAWADGSQLSLATAKRLGLGAFCPTLDLESEGLVYRDCAADSLFACVRRPN